jgi:predicted transcriptional regulator of viral defense system
LVSKKLGPTRPSGNAARMRASPWRGVFRLAAAQGGLLSARQADELGCSLKQLSKYVHSGKLERVQRGVYRVAEFPPGEHDDLMAAWLWSRGEGAISHETALYLHDLSNVLPSKAHITLPLSWKRRTVQIPADIAVHYDDLLPSERGWIGSLPTTTVRRTLLDCLHGSLSPELVEQAFAQAAARGLISSQETVRAPFVSFSRGRSA